MKKKNMSMYQRCLCTIVGAESTLVITLI
jgi:hypothetical protein